MALKQDNARMMWQMFNNFLVLEGQKFKTDLAEFKGPVREQCRK